MNPNARTENVTICMTVREKQFFRKKADEQGITLTEYIRNFMGNWELNAIKPLVVLNAHAQ